MGSSRHSASSRINSLDKIFWYAFVLTISLLSSPYGLQAEVSSSAAEGVNVIESSTPDFTPGATTTKVAKNVTFYPIVSHGVGWVSTNLSDMDFLLYHNSSDPEMYEVLPHSVSGEHTHFRVNRPLKVLIHGFTEDRTTEFPKNLKNAYLHLLDETPEEKRFNILVVDWGKLAGAPKSVFSPLYYVEAVDNVNSVGKHIADFLISMVDAKIIESFDEVHVIGFSLGGQVAGVVGCKIFHQFGHKVGRITGLDPAGPLFYSVPEENALDSSDAIFVDVIHTNAGLLGHSKPLGHIDIFPNGGRKQPGCLKDWGGVCSHRTAHQLYVKSVSDASGLLACKCGSWEEFSKCSADCVDQIKVGEPLEITARGSYYCVVE